MVDWSWFKEGITDEAPRTTGPECINYMSNRRRWTEAIILNIIFVLILRWAIKRLQPIVLPSAEEINKPHSAIRLMLLLIMTFTFGIEIGFKFAGKSFLNVFNPCHLQTVVQIYLLAAKPSKTTIALFRIQMNNLNGPVLAIILPEVEGRTFAFEQATYWVQHAMLYIIPVYILSSGAYEIEDFYDYNWVVIGVMIMLLYHFVLLNAISIYTDINVNHMLCAALSDPFQGQNYRIAAVIHESILCPLLNKLTVLIFQKSKVPTSNLLVNNNAGSSSFRSYQSIENSNIEDELEIDEELLQYGNQTDGQLQACDCTDCSATGELSLAAEIAAATGVPLKVDEVLKHRHRVHHSTTRDDDQQPNLNTVNLKKPTTITTMPTTKID